MKTSFILITIVAILNSCVSDYNEYSDLEGKPLPAFSIRLADSTTVINTSNIPNDKPVVLFFFGPHCPYSHGQIKRIIENMDDLKDIRFFLITNSPFEEMKTFSENYHLNRYGNIKTGVDKDNFFINYYQAMGVPFIVVYNNKKILTKIFVGSTKCSKIKSASIS